MKRTMVLTFLVSIFGLIMSGSLWSASAQGVPEVTLSTFTPPSLSFSASALIKEKKFDLKNGIKINFAAKESRTAQADYTSGQDKITATASILRDANLRAKGLKASFVFSSVDYFGSVLTEKEDIKTIKDLEGRTLAANTVTTNYALFQYFANKAGVDLKKINILSATTPALITYIVAKRVDAVQVWEPAFSQLLFQYPGRFHPVIYHEDWKKYFGRMLHGYVGVAALDDWIKDNEKLLPKIYMAYKDMVDWANSNIEEASKIVAEKSNIPFGAVKLSFESGRMAFYTATNEDIKDDIWTIVKGSVETGYIEKMPDEGFLYMGLKKLLGGK